MTESIKKEVLVVDDEADIRDFLEAALVEAGFNVTTAEDGEIALAKIKEKMPDLISLDLVMPKKSGAKLYRQLSKHKEWSKIPVIIVTGHARDDLGKTDLKELTMSGPGVYLEKPVKPNNYIAAIKNILKMDVNEEERELSEMIKIQNDLKNMIDSANPDSLKTLKELIDKIKK